ncbi:MAG: urease accessory protein UreD [Pseudomonadota bacterium]|nr:urease accessory protein UreD [Pseudomonadota bacterium]
MSEVGMKWWKAMYGDTLPSNTEGGSLRRMHGAARVMFTHRDGQSRLAELDQRTPMRVLFPKVPAGTPPVAAVTTVSGGLVGGDTLDIEVSVGDRAAATAIGQAAEKVYRSNGPDSNVEIALNVGEGAWLEWLPQETILFDGARLNRRTVTTISPGGRLLAGECLVFGRLASGETMAHGKVRDAWEVRDQKGRLYWADTLFMEEDILRLLDSPSGFDGARAYATAIYVGSNTAATLQFAKDLTDVGDDVRSGATCRGNVLITRWLSDNPLAVRKQFERYWMKMRNRVGGLTESLSRLWHV